MDEKVIRVHSFTAKDTHPSGFTTGQFKKLDGLFLQAAAAKTLTYRTVECDFDNKTASYTYYQREHQPPFLQFKITQVGPRTMMYEVYKQSKGRITKSGLFEKAFERLQAEILALEDN